MYIGDFKPFFQGKITQSLIDKFKELAQRSIDHFSRVLPKAFENHDKVILATHVPPFEESAWYMGRKSDPEFLPFFSNKILGDFLKKYMEQNTDKSLTVLCGHTHGGQICLPGGIPIFTHLYSGRKFYRGLWNYGNMKGYTSPGCGAVAIPVRFNSQSEIALITLKKKRS